MSESEREMHRYGDQLSSLSHPDFSLKPGRTDQRVHPRFDVELEVGFGWSAISANRGFTENLSEGGLFVATRERHPIGSSVELVLRALDHPQPIRVSGRVRWLRFDSAPGDEGPGMGIQFESLSSEQKDTIRRIVTEHVPLYFEDIK